jgi:hypothetical protein
MTEYVDLDAMRRKIRRRKLRDNRYCVASDILDMPNLVCTNPTRAVRVYKGELDVPSMIQWRIEFICDVHLDMRLDQLYAERQGSHE